MCLCVSKGRREGGYLESNLHVYCCGNANRKNRSLFLQTSDVSSRSEFLIQENQKDIVRLLVAHGADLTIQDKDGELLLLQCVSVGVVGCRGGGRV